MDFRSAADADLGQIARLMTDHHLGHFEVSADSLKAGKATRRHVLAEGERVLAVAAVADAGQGAAVRRVELFAGLDADSDGMWTALHDHVSSLLADEGVESVQSVVREDYPAVERLSRAGYRVGWSSWAAHLHVDGPLPEVADPDVVELGAEHAAAAFELYEACLPDFPWTPATAPTRYSQEEFAALLDSTRAFGVFDGSACVALTVLEVESDDDAETAFTVVAAEHRKSGLAKRVKAVAVATLSAEGVRTFGTGGAAANAASLRMNQALGYVVDPLWRTYVLELRP